MVKEFRTFALGVLASLCVIMLPAGTATADTDAAFADMVRTISADRVEYPLVDLDVVEIVETVASSDAPTSGGAARRLERQPLRYGLKAHIAFARAGSAYHMLC